MFLVIARHIKSKLIAQIDVEGITKLSICHPYGTITRGETSDKLLIPMTTGRFLGDATRNRNLAPAYITQGNH
jgi:hypothetical protein